MALGSIFKLGMVCSSLHGYFFDEMCDELIVHSRHCCHLLSCIGVPLRVAFARTVYCVCMLRVNERGLARPLANA